MMYILKDNKDKSFRVVGTLKNILDFLNYPNELNYIEAKKKLENDEQYQNNVSTYYIEETNIRVTDKAGNLQAYVNNIWEGLEIIEWFECQDDEEDVYEPRHYDIVDDNYVSLL